MSYWVFLFVSYGIIFTLLPILALFSIRNVVQRKDVHGVIRDVVFFFFMTSLWIQIEFKLSICLIFMGVSIPALLLILIAYAKQPKNA